MRKRFSAGIVFLAAVMNSVTVQADGLLADGLFIQSAFSDSFIVIRSSNRTAGTIDSLTWNGKEFIDTFDHGRQLQSASSFNGWGECFNPTEAGSCSDGVGPTSTSVLLALSMTNNMLFTKTQMAFWLRPGQSSPFCGNGMTTAQNKSVLSNHILTKWVTVGWANIPNVILHLIEFTIPERYDSAVFEALTGYMPLEFSCFWTYDPILRILTPLSDGPGEQSLPIIFSTPDKNYAMGIYSVRSLSPDCIGPTYGRVRFYDQNVVKWNCVFRKTGGVPAKGYSFYCFSIVGTLQDVTESMNKLYAIFPN